jgi:hypothetical protein
MMLCQNLVRLALPLLPCALLSSCAVGVERLPNMENRAPAREPDASVHATDGQVAGRDDAGGDTAHDAAVDGAADVHTQDGATALDAMAEREDAASAGQDASLDEVDAAAVTRADAAVADAAPVRVERILDGVLAADEWRDAASSSQGVASDWGANQLTYLAAALDDTFLWLAVRGRVESDKNAIVVYLDSEAGAGVAPRAITDQSDEDQLDDALSGALSVPAGFLADYAWGTLRMASSVRGANAHTGFRGLQNPGDLAWVDAPAPPMDAHVAHTVCLADACEARIPLATLGGTGDIKLFARLTNSDGEAFANQTLPLDDPSAPAAVSSLLTLER